MTRRDGLFAAGVLALSALVPGPLVALGAFAEERSTLGVLSGWGLAVLMMVPSYLLLGRAVAEDNPHRFVRACMAGMLLRLALTGAGILVFALCVRPTPFKSFLVVFLLGYALLQALELTLTLRGARRRAAPEWRP